MVGFFDEFVRNLTLPCATKPIQNKDMARPNVTGEVFIHLVNNVPSASEDASWRRARLQNQSSLDERLIMDAYEYLQVTAVH
jgi:hypothetical protein